MNNNFMGFFDPTHNNPGMNPDFSRGPPGQQGGFGSLPPNVAQHGGMNIPGYQHHQRLLPFENSHMMGPLSPGMSNMPTPGSGIGPPSAGRMMDMNFSRMPHYRATQQSHIQHSPGSLSPMPGMAGGPSGQSPYGLRMPNLAPKQQMLEARLQSSLGNGITRWPRMPSVVGLSRPQMPHLFMSQGPVPMLQNTNDFQLGDSPTISNADMLRLMKMDRMDSDDAYTGPGMSLNSLDFPPSHPFPPNQNPYSIDSQLSQPPPLKQSGGGQIPMSQSPLSFGQPQSLSYGPPVSKSFVDSYSKFIHQLPHSPKLSHFGPSQSNDIFDQPSNPLTPLASQQKSPFSPFGNTFNENMNSPVGLRNIPQPLPLESSSPVMPSSSMDIRSPTKVNPLLNQIQQLKLQIAQMEGNPMNQGSPQLAMLKQQLEHTYIQFISLQRSNEFPVPKESTRMPQGPQDFYLDKPPMTPRSQADYSLDKPPPTPRPQHPTNDFRMEKVPKPSSRAMQQNEFNFEKSLSQAHLQQEFLLKKSPQTPIGPPHHDIFDKPPMTPRPAHPHDFIMDKSQQPLTQSDYILDKPPSTPRQKAQPGFVFGKPHLPLTQPQLVTSRNDNFSQSQLHLSQPNYFDKPPSTPRPQPMQQEPMLEKPPTMPHQMTAPEYPTLDKMPSSTGNLASPQMPPTPGTMPSTQPQTNFNMVKSPVGTQAAVQLPLQPQQPPRPTHIPLQSPLRSPPSFFSQASQSPMSSMSTPIQSVSQQQETDMDLKDDIAFLDELLQAKLNEPSVKQDPLSQQPSSRKNSMNRAPNPMPVLDGMHSSAPSPTIPPTMPVLAPSVPPPATMAKYDSGMPDANHGIVQSPMHSIPMPFPMQIPSGPMPMYAGMQDQSHLMMMHSMYGMNYGLMPSIRPPQLRNPNAKEKSKANKNKGSDLGPAAKRKKVRRKSSESDTLVPSPKTPVTPATPSSTSNTSIVNPASNVSSVNSGESIAAVNPFMLDDNPVDNAATRRSLRERKKRNYNDDYDYNISDDEEKKKGENGEQVNIDIPGGHKLIPYKPSDAVEGEIATIERILAGRIRSNTKDEEGNDEEEFCVKYKGYSYLHCEWGTEKELSKKDKRVPMKVKRFKAKRDPFAILSELDDEPFNPDFVEVDRVLDQSSCIDQVTGEPVTHYLVKWRSLPYEDSTWELEVNVDEPKIKQYVELKKPPPPEFQKYVPRPQAFQWKKIEKSPEYKDGNTLRDYQLEGLNWLSFCWYKRQNCILADEMGLGKTVQSISLLCELKRYGVRGPFLIIAPLSTIVHWQREFETWTDINTIVYHGSSPSRLLIQQYEMSYTNEKGEKIPGFYKFEAVVTTYEMILSDNDMLSKIPWRCAVIDEAHRLKNKNCKLLEGLNKLQLEHRVLLTGTPLQNNVEELFSLLNFLEPTRFPSQAAFLLEFGNLKTEAQVEKLQQILKPMMLRRLKEDVEKNVPPKEETIIEVELTTIQKKFYRAILEKNLTFLTRGLSSASNTPNLMNAMMELRKCCNHPFLINGAEERIVSEYTDGTEGHETITKHFKAMTESSGKMVLIDKLLPKLKAGGHKVLIFSQMIRVLDLLEDYLLCKKYLYERIDGRVRGNARQAAIDRFCRVDSDRFVFLLCTRAGGLGINLTAADTVIIFDSDWNPQNDLQAQARCHRIGQNKPVKIYRLICRNTYERDMFDKASRKLALDRAVLQNMNYIENSPASSLLGNTIPGGALPGSAPFPGNGSIQGDASPGMPSQVQPQPLMSKKEIEDILKRGAYGALMDEDGNASTKFCEEDIDQILERRTQIIQIIGEGKGSTFAKASFISNTAKMDIDIDDPDFWTKWAQKAAVDVNDVSKENLIIDKPRERKQTKRFGNEDGSAELSEAESGDEEEKPLTDVVRTAWSRVECFRVEKNILVYGWGRWRDFLLHDNFKVQISERELEAIGRTILVFCLHHFKGDEKVKIFISSTITKSVTRSRLISHDAASKEVVKDEPYTPDSSDPSKQKKPVKPSKRGTQNSKPVLVEAGPDWKTVDPDNLIIDPGYRKHLAHHSKKILSRVKLLWCLRHEIIGSFADKILLGLPASDIALQVPHVDGEAPTTWWDVEADKSLLIGVFKHGYDKYNAIKTDPCLCFASKLRLSGFEVEKNTSFSPEHGPSERNEEDNPNSIGKRKRKKRDHDDDGFNTDEEVDRDDDAESYSMMESPLSMASPNPASDATQSQGLHPSLKWPQAPDLNTRLRRLITGYLKGCEKEQMKLAQQEKDKEKRERQAQQQREKELKKAEMALRWSRREVTDFYRVVTTFGIIYDEDAKIYDWSKFRKMAKLDKKDDERITAYFEEFSAMCRRVCNQSTSEDVETKRGENLEPISDERAHRVLHRVNLLNTIRNKVLNCESLDERLALCEPSNDFPVWWKAGTHDKELLIGVAKHGVGRTDFNLFSDENLCFKGILNSLALQMKKRKQEQLAKQNQSKDIELTSVEEGAAAPRPVNSTAADSQTTSSSETPSTGVNADRQPVATQHENKPQPPSQTPPVEDKEEFVEDTSVSKEEAEILAAWPKDKALLGRLEKICQCVLNNAWPKNARVELRTHGHNGQNHPTLPGSFDRADLLRQPTVSVGGEDGPRGEMAEGLLSPDKNFKVTSLDGLKITVKKKRRRRTKEQMAAAAAAKAQLAQVPPPEHLQFPVNDVQVSGMAAHPNEKVKRRRKRKVDIIDSTANNVSSQPLQDEPPLKVVPHPVKYTSVADTGPTDLEVTLNPSIILHVPASMDQRSSRLPSSVRSTPPHNVSSQSNVSSITSHVPERRNLSSPNFSHSIDNLVHSNSHSGSSITSSARPSTIDHLPNISRQRSVESSDGSFYRSSAQQQPNAPSQGPKTPQRISKSDGISERSDQRNKEVPWSAVSSSSYRLVDHATVISPNVNPFDKNRSAGDTNIFDMLPLHMQSSANKDYKNTVMACSSADIPVNATALKQNHELQSRSEAVTPPGLTRHLEGHKASAAMAALAAKLHSQQVSNTARSKQEKYLPTKDSAPFMPFQGDEHGSRSSMSPVMNIRSPPLPVTKSSTLSYRHRMSEENLSAAAHIKSTVASGNVSVNDPVKTTSVNVTSSNAPKASHVDPNKYNNKSIVGHPHSMASLLGAHSTKNLPSTPVTSSALSSPLILHKPPIEDDRKDTPPIQHLNQKQRMSEIDAIRSTVASLQQAPSSSSVDNKTNQQRSQSSAVPPSQPPNIPGTMSYQTTVTPASKHSSVKPDHSLVAGESSVNNTPPSTRLTTSDAIAKSAEGNSSTSATLPNFHSRNISVNSKSLQVKSKAPRASKTAHAKTVIKRVNPTVSKPSLSNVSRTTSNTSTFSGGHILSSAAAQQPIMSNASKHQLSTTSSVSPKEHFNLTVSAPSHTQQHTRQVKDSVSHKTLHITTSSTPTTATSGHGAKESSKNPNVVMSSESEPKQNSLGRLEEVSAGLSAEKPLKSMKLLSSVSEGPASMVTSSLATTSSQLSSLASKALTASAPTYPVRTMIHSSVASTVQPSKPSTVLSSSKSTAYVPRTSPQSVIKFSPDIKPTVSSNIQKSSIGNTTLQAPIRDADANKPKVIIATASKARPLKSSQAIEHTTSVISIASVGAPKTSNSTSVSAATISASSASKKPISVQIVTATSNVVACLSAAAALSQVHSIVKPNTGKPKSSSETSVVSTILRVIPSLVSKSDSTKEQSLTPTLSKGTCQNGSSGLMKPVTSAQTTQSLKSTTSKGHVTSVPFSTAVKVTVVSSSGSENVQVTKPAKLHPESSLLRTVTSSSNTTPNINTKPTHKGTPSGKQSRGAPVPKQTKSQRLSNISTSSADEDESEAVNNAPVASRTRPSTRRITSLSALGPGPMKKGGRNTPVTSPKGANVTSPKGGSVTSPKGGSVTSPKAAASSKAGIPSKSQVISPNSSKASIAQALITIPGVISSKPVGKSNLPSFGSSGERSNAVGKIPAVDSKAESDQAMKEPELATTHGDTVLGPVSQSHCKLDSTVAALAKLNESITIQTTRTVTSVADRPKKQKRSLASIVTDLASKGAHQTTIPTTASSSSTDSKVAHLASSCTTNNANEKTSSQNSDSKGACQSEEKLTANNAPQKDPLDGKVTVVSSDEVQSTQASQNTNSTTKCVSESLGKDQENAPPQAIEAKSSKDINQTVNKTIEPVEATKDLTEDKSTDQGTKDKSTDQSTKGESTDQGTKGESTDQGTKGESTDQGTKGKSTDQGTKGKSTDQGTKDSAVAQSIHNDTEHNYSEKASASKQNYT